MKIAIHNPEFIFQDQVKNFNGYNIEFLKNHTDIIYISRPWHIVKYIQRFRELKIDIRKFHFIYTISSLNKNADVLISFNGSPYIKHYSPPKKYIGLKVWHIMDYVFKANKSNNILVENGVDFLMGYARHDLYCPFFQKYYSHFNDKIISVPFGYGKRFDRKTSIDSRINKCIALGSINPVNDPLCRPGILNDYIDFYMGEVWTHKFRRKLAENLTKLEFILESKLPSLEKTKNSSYDPVDELNQYMFFVNDEGLMNFPPARTYEGIACGSIMIASKNKIYNDLGFIDGENYIAFEKNNLEDFTKKTLDAINKKYDLKKIQSNSLKLASLYNHEKVAKRLYFKIREII